MPLAYVIHAELRLVVVRAWGVLSTDEVLAVIGALYQDPQFRSDFRELVDARKVTVLHVSPAGIREIATSNPYSSAARRAIVVSSEVAFGMARMYEMMRDPSPDEVQVFREYASALEWLGVSERELPDHAPEGH
jgi:hypothetical protein